MKICPRCGAPMDDQIMQCPNCGLEFAPQPPAEMPPQGQEPMDPLQGVPQEPVQPQQPQAPGFIPPAPPQWGANPPQGIPQQTPGFMPPPAGYPSQRKIFQWVDVCTIFGFVSSVIGCFWASVLLLPIGLVFSIIGYRGDRTRALAVAGIVIAAVGLLVKIMMILYRADILPYWFTDGIF